MNKLTVLFICFFLSKISIGQNYKYEEVTGDLLKLDHMESFPNVDAIVTYCAGNTHIRYFESEGFKAVIEEKAQIKIFNNNAKNVGTIKLYFYSPTNEARKWKINSIKGKTYNLVDDKIVTTKLEKENIFESQYNNYYKEITILMPNLLKNSVFEYEFTSTTAFFTNLPEWKVQSVFPVLYNEYHSIIPEYFNIQVNIVGGIVPISDESSFKTEQVLLTGVSNRSVAGRELSMQNINLRVLERNTVFKNVPPVEIEPYQANPKDNYGKITFQLVSLNIPDQAVDDLATDYHHISKELLDKPYFGDRIKPDKYIEKQIVISDDAPLKEKAEKIYNYFADNLKWNDFRSIYSEKNMKSIFKEVAGNTGEINLSLISALNNFGIPTYPVILSTRGHGILHPIYPNLASFDYVVALSIIDEKPFLSDATSKLPFGFLPEKCLNGNGWKVSDNDSGWINLKEGRVGKQIIQSEIEIKDSKVKYDLKFSNQNYLAFDDIQKIEKDGEQEFLKSLELEPPYSLVTKSLLDRNPNSIKIAATYENVLEDSSVIYLSPFIKNPYPISPFNSENRISVIDFPFALDYKLVSTISIPMGYSYEVPQNALITVFEKSIVLKYSSSFNEGIQKLTIVVDMKINDTEFEPIKYGDFKEAFNLIANKLNEKVVLKRL